MRLMTSMSQVLKALANPRRLAILQSLRQHRQASVIELSHVLKLSFRSTSKHLQVLSQQGLVEPERAGMQVDYHLGKKLPRRVRKLLMLIFE